ISNRQGRWTGGEVEVECGRGLDNKSEGCGVSPNRRTSSGLDSDDGRGRRSSARSCEGDRCRAGWAARTVGEGGSSYTSWKSCENTEGDWCSCCRCIESCSGCLDTSSTAGCNC